MLKIPNFVKDKDIKYSGILSYRYLRIIGWLAVLLSQIAVIITTKANLTNSAAEFEKLMTAANVLDTIGQVSIPLFLIANFSIIFNSRDNILTILRNHFLCALGLYAAFFIVYYHYLTPLALKIDPQGGKKFLQDFMFALFSERLSFNVFIDLLMCSLVFFFLFYTPQRVFVGKKIYIFRALVALPILYEIASILLKGLSVGNGLFVLPIPVLPILTTKPVYTFVSFLIISIVLKIRNYLVIPKDATVEEREKYFHKNLNSLDFSILVSFVFLVASLLDFLTVKIFSSVLVSSYPDITEAATYRLITVWGFGKAVTLSFAVPFTLLFSYTKTHPLKTKTMDTLIPLIGVALVVAVYIEGYFQIGMSALSKL